MTIDSDVVLLRLQMMRELLGDLGSLGPVDGKRLNSERITRHAVERILTQLVELAVSINSHVAATSDTVPSTYRESFFEAAKTGLIPEDLAERLAPSAGLRNLLTHDYVKVDLDLVATAVASAEADYGDYVRHVARAISQP